MTRCLVATSSPGTDPSVAGPMPSVRRPTPDDRARLAELMLDAYIGTIDYDGETLQMSVDEVDRYFAGKSGEPLLEHSLVALDAGTIVSVALISSFREMPMVAYLYTDPAWKRRGLAEGLLRAAMASLAAAGHDRIHLFVTAGNVTAERIYERLGFMDAPLDAPAGT